MNQFKLNFLGGDTKAINDDGTINDVEAFDSTWKKLFCETGQRIDPIENWDCAPI